jgi:Acetyltransferase (GNAT) domain
LKHAAPGETVEQIVTAPITRSFVIVRSILPPALEAGWREYLTRVEAPGQYDAPDFFLEPYWEGSHPFAILAFDEGRIIGSLTGIHPAGVVECGLPWRPQVRIARDADPDLASKLLMDGLLQEAANAKLITVYAWDSTPLPAFAKHGFRTGKLEGDIVLDLKLGPDAIFKQFHENRKRNIKTAIKNGIHVSEAQTAEDLAEYFEVHSAWLGTARKKIRAASNRSAIAKTHEMTENHRRFLARYQGKVIAATGVRFLRGGLIEYAGNCSSDEFIHLRPNDLLIWRTIQWACEQGFSKYSLGGAHPFLRKSGGTVVPIYSYTLDQTFLRRHDLKEHLVRVARQVVDRIPAPLGTAIRQVIRNARSNNKLPLS